MGRIRIFLLEVLICYVQRMYRTPLLSATNFAEEILPGADLFPTATLGKVCFRLYLSERLLGEVRSTTFVLELHDSSKDLP